MYDSIQQFVKDAELCVAVLGKQENFIFVDLIGKLSEDASDAALAKGYQFCGVLGLYGGVAGARCEPGPENLQTMVHAGLAWAQIVAAKLKPHAKGDEVAWLEALHELPDTREVL